MIMQPEKRLQLPKRIKSHYRRGHKAWLNNCSMHLEHNTDRNKHYAEEWLEPNITLGSIMAHPSECLRTFRLPPETMTSVAAVAVTAVDAGSKRLGNPYPLDGVDMVDEVLMLLGGMPETIGGVDSREFRQKLIERAVWRVGGNRWMHLRLVTPMIEELIEAMPPHLRDVRYVDSPAEARAGLEAMVANGEAPANHVCWAPKASGKTEDFMAKLPGIFKYGYAGTHRTILAGKIQTDLECRHYKTEFDLLKTPNQGWTSYCVNSFLDFIKTDEGKAELERAQCVAFDEWLGIFNSIALGRSGVSHEGPMAFAETVLRIVVGIFEDRGKTTVSLDANMSQKAVQFIAAASLRANKKLVMWMVQATPESKEKAKVAAEAKWGKAICPSVYAYDHPNDVIQRYRMEMHHNPGKCHFFGGAGADGVEALANHLNQAGFRVLPVTSELKDEPDAKALFHNPNSFPREYGYNGIAVTSSFAEGSSLGSKDYSPTVCLNYSSNLAVQFQTMDQMPLRVRRVEEIHIAFNTQHSGGRNNDAETTKRILRQSGWTEDSLESGKMTTPGVRDVPLDSYTEFSTWARDDIEFSRINGMQLLAMHWEYLDYTLLFDSDDIADDPETFWENQQMRPDDLKDEKENLKEEKLRGILGADEIEGDGIKELMNQGIAATKEIRPVLDRAYNIALLEASRSHDYYPVNQTDQGKKERNLAKKKDKLAAGKEGAVLLDGKEGAGLLEYARQVNYSFGKKRRFRNVVIGSWYAPGKGRAAIDRVYTKTHRELATLCVGALGADIITGQGTWGSEEEEKLKTIIAQNLYVAIGSKVIAERFLFGETGEDKKRNFISGVDADSCVASVLGALGLKRESKERGRYGLKALNHRFSIGILYREGPHELDRGDADVIWERIGEVVKSPLQKEPHVKGNAAAEITRLIKEGDGILPLTPKSIITLENRRKEKGEGKGLSESAAKTRTRKYKKETLLPVIRDLGLCKVQVKLTGVDMGDGKSRGLEPFVLVKKSFTDDTIVGKIGDFFQTESVELVEMEGNG